MQAELLTRHVVFHSDAISEIAGADTSTIILNKKKPIQCGKNMMLGRVPFYEN